MVNLSSKTLSQDAINLLSNGLGYAQVHAQQDRSNPKMDLEALATELHTYTISETAKKHIC